MTTIQTFIREVRAEIIETRDYGSKVSYSPGQVFITVATESGSFELPWENHPAPLVGTPVKLTIEVGE